MVIKKALLIATNFLFVAVGCASDMKPPAFKFEVYTTNQTIPEIISLVEMFSLKEGLHQLKDGIAPITGTSVSVHFNDAPEISNFIVVSNGNLENKDHVEVSIFVMSHVKGCSLCKKFEVSDELKKIKEKFEIKNVVKNGEW